MSILGPLISAGASLAGGLINRSHSEDVNQRLIHQGNLNRAAQEEFAKKGIRWRVADARAAGIHPLYALGAQTTSFSPVSVGQSADTSLGSSVASAGQDISRAMNATRTQDERTEAFTKTVQDLELTNMGLKNELLASQIAKLKSTINPPFPQFKNAGDDLFFGGDKIKTDPGSSNVEDWQTRFGEPAEWIMALPTAIQDAKKNNVDTMSLLTAAWRWLDRNADPQFSVKLFDQIMGRR